MTVFTVLKTPAQLQYNTWGDKKITAIFFQLSILNT